ncbi:MAG: FG-GAP-like repeat-containing protein, partial [bacterium]
MRDDVFGTALPEAHDSMEYSIESYRSYIDAPVTKGALNEKWGYAQSLMMDDVASIQQMYGANFSAVGQTVVYSWDPHSGEEFINGVGQGAPGGDRIFMTVWDQGAAATYDLSNYTTNLTIDLRPGHWSTFDPAQLADLGAISAPGVHLAAGNVANALEYQNDPRSLVQAAIGGSGHNTIIGNDADNYLYGGTGGHNIIQGGAGNDVIDGGTGPDNTVIYTGARSDYQITELPNGWLQVADLRAGTPDGMDQVTDIQHFQFNDGTYSWQEPSPQIYTSAPTTADIILERADDGTYTMFDIGNDTVLASYGLGRVAVDLHFLGLGDFNGDGTPDIAVGTGPGTVAEVKIFDGKTQAVLFDIQPFETFTGGVFVAAGDITGDGKADFVITPDLSGGPRVEIH